MQQGKRPQYFLPTVIFLTLLTAGTFAWVSWFSSAQTRALDALSPLLVPLASLFRQNSGYGHPWFLYLALIVIVTLGILTIRLESRSSRALLYFGMLAVAAQLFLVDREICFLISQKLGLSKPGSTAHFTRDDRVISISAGIILYTTAILTLLLGRRRAEENSSIFDLGRRESAHFGLREAVLLTLIFIIALIFRTYALNVLPDSFEGELSPFSAAATSLQGMFIANKGAYGPWAPLGILYYIPIYITTEAFGVTILSLRLSSALVGLFTLPLVYLLAARLAGRSGGLLAAALFALECLHLGWSRTDVHPHGVTTWPTLLMCWFLIKAYDTRKISWACGVALIMGLSWHQYPSGQSAVAIPLLAVGIFWISNRFKLPLKLSQTALISMGVILWFVGLPLSYYLADGNFHLSNPFTLTGPRTSWGEDGLPSSSLGVMLLVLSKAAAQFGHVLQGIFYRQPYLFHQEWIAYSDMVYGRTVAWLEVPFVVLGICIVLLSIKRFESAVLLAWIMAALLPGILSEHAYPKRLSTLFPALDIVAAIALASVLATLPAGRAAWKRLVATLSLTVVFGSYIAFTNYAWFSGRYWKYGEPVENTFATKISQLITPGTIVIADLNRSYEIGKYLFLTLDHLTSPENRPNLWITAQTPTMPQLIAQPLSAVALAPASFAYTWTKLRDQLGETTTFTGWTKVLFIIQAGPEDTAVNISHQTAASTRCANPKVIRLERERSALNTLVLIECSIADLK